MKSYFASRSCFSRHVLIAHHMHIGDLVGRKGEPGDTDSVRPGQLKEFGPRGPSSLRHKCIVRCQVFDKSVTIAIKPTSHPGGSKNLLSVFSCCSFGFPLLLSLMLHCCNQMLHTHYLSESSVENEENNSSAPGICNCIKCGFCCFESRRWSHVSRWWWDK